jgi:hypothetical protein
MVRPVPFVGEGELLIPTSHWPKFLNLHVLFDPYKPSNPQGGRRNEDQYEKYCRDKPLIVVAVDSEEVLPEVMVVFRSLVDSDLKSNTYTDIQIVHSK